MTILPLLLLSAILWQPGVALPSPPEYLHPTAGSWTLTGSLATARESHTATLLPSGKVLVVGGFGGVGFGGTYLKSAELYDPALGSWTATGSLVLERAYHTATLLSSGKVLVRAGSVVILA